MADQPTPSESDALEQSLLATSRAWIAGFNRGDVAACVAAYAPDAVMNARPMGSFTGRAEIEGFWRPFLESGAGELVYSDVKLEVVDARSVVLSASWSMNVGRGVITKELWLRQDDQSWLLQEDDFEVQEQFA